MGANGERPETILMSVAAAFQFGVVEVDGGGVDNLFVIVGSGCDEQEYTIALREEALVLAYAAALTQCEVDCRPTSLAYRISSGMQEADVTPHPFIREAEKADVIILTHQLLGAASLCVGDTPDDAISFVVLKLVDEDGEFMLGLHLSDVISIWDLLLSEHTCSIQPGHRMACIANELTG